MQTDTINQSVNFKEYFRFPLKGDYGLVFTYDNRRAFDFANSWCYRDGLIADDNNQANIIEVLNGSGKKITTDLKLSHDNGIIYSEINGRKQELIIIRGWGYLTGTGGLNLKDDLAAVIQDEFANYIVKMLTVEADK